MALKALRDFFGRIFHKEPAAKSYAADQEGLLYNNNNAEMRSQIGGADRAVVTDTGTHTLTNKTIDADNSTITNLTHGAEVDDPSTGVHGVTGSVVGTTDTQTLTNKTIDADNSTITNLAHGAEVDNPSSGVHGVTGDVVGTSDTQTLSAKTLSSPTINTPTIDIQTLPHQTTPANPAAGNIKIYPKNDDSLYTLDSAGNEVALGSGGGGETNTGSSIGTGDDVFKQKTGVNLEFRSILEGQNFNTLQNANDLTFSILDSIVSKTADYTMTVADTTVLVDASSGAVTITLPAASGITGKIYYIKATDVTNTVTVDGNAAETIDGSTTVTIDTVNEGIEVQSDGTNFQIISTAGGATTPGGGGSGDEFVYAMAGTVSGVNSATADKYNILLDTNINVAAALATARSATNAQGSSDNTNAITVNGFGLTSIEVMPFATDTGALSAQVTPAARFSGCGLSSDNDFYILGGQAAATDAQILKGDLPTQTSSIIGSVLSAAQRFQSGGTEGTGKTFGIAVGGDQGTGRVVEKILYSTDAISTFAAVLTLSNFQGASGDSDTVCYLFGHVTPTNLINSVFFATATEVAIVATMVGARQNMSSGDSGTNTVIQGGWNGGAEVNVIEVFAHTTDTISTATVTLVGTRNDHSGNYKR